MGVRVEIKMDEESMADFMTYHIYTSIVGIIACLLGGLNVGLTAVFIMMKKYPQAVLFGAFIIIIFVLFPWYIRKKVVDSFRRSKDPDAVTVYEFTDDGVTVERKDVSGLIPWSEFTKAIKRKQILVLFRQNKKGVVFPLNQMQDVYEEVVDMIYEHMDAPKVRIMRTGKKSTDSAGSKK